MNFFANKDCVEGCKQHISDNSVDLIITDPPYGIQGETLHKHYNRDESTVLPGYIDVAPEHYAEFTEKWMAQAERILRPGGSMYVISGYTRLFDILNALTQTELKQVNHIIWHFNFGVYTTQKFVSSHYHILYCTKPGGAVTFNKDARFPHDEKASYHDREDVWSIKREYKPGAVKNKNELPIGLVRKMIEYSSNEGDLVCDLFLGGFTTAKAAIGLNRRAIGFELNQTAFDYEMKEIEKITPGEMLEPGAPLSGFMVEERSNDTP